MVDKHTAMFAKVKHFGSDCRPFHVTPSLNRSAPTVDISGADGDTIIWYCGDCGATKREHDPARAREFMNSEIQLPKGGRRRLGPRVRPGDIRDNCAVCGVPSILVNGACHRCFGRKQQPFEADARTHICGNIMPVLVQRYGTAGALDKFDPRNRRAARECIDELKGVFT